MSHCEKEHIYRIVHKTNYKVKPVYHHLGQGIWHFQTLVTAPLPPCPPDDNPSLMSRGVAILTFPLIVSLLFFINLPYMWTSQNNSFAYFSIVYK